MKSLFSKFSLVFVLFLSFAPGAWAVAFHLPEPQVERLPNGLEIAWFLDDKIPLVDVTLLVRRGFRDDPSGKSGVASLMAAAMDRGSAGQTAAEIARNAENLGATYQSSAGDDTSSVTVHGLAPDAPKLLSLLANLSLRPDFKDAEVKREKLRMVDQWAHIDDYAESLGGMTYARLVAAGTPYARGSVFNLAELQKVSREDVISFYRGSFVPQGALLVIVGRVDQPKFREQILREFGDWKGVPGPRQTGHFSDPVLSKAAAPNEVVLIDRPGLNQAQVRVGFRAPGLQAPDHSALVLGNSILGEYFNSRLNTKLRDELGLAYSVTSGFAFSEDLSIFTIASATQNSTVGELLKKGIEVLDGMRTQPVTEEEVTTAREYLVGGFPVQTSTLGAVASRWVVGELFGLGKDYLNEFLPKIQAVKREDVVSAWTKLLKAPRTIVVAGDGAKIEPVLKSAGFRVRRVSAEKWLEQLESGANPSTKPAGKSGASARAKK